MKLSSTVALTTLLALCGISIPINIVNAASIRGLEDPNVDDGVPWDADGDDAIQQEYFATNNDDSDTTSPTALRFSVWPPPPSRLLETNCQLRLDSCVSHQDTHNAHQELTTLNASVAVTLVCKDYPTQEGRFPTYVLDRSKFLRLVVEHQRRMAGDFCILCTSNSQCTDHSNAANYNNNAYTNYNNNNDAYATQEEMQQQQAPNPYQNGNNNNNAYHYNNNNAYGNYYDTANATQEEMQQQQAPDPYLNVNGNNNNAYYGYGNYYNTANPYRFLPAGSDVGSQDSVLYYECEACLAECRLRPSVVETALAYSTCSPIIQPTAETPTYVGPVCENMETALQHSSPRLDFGIFQDETCQTVRDDPLEGRLNGQELLQYYATTQTPTQIVSNAMWQSILTLPCIETPESGPGTIWTPEDSLQINVGWCKSILEDAQSCNQEWEDSTNLPLCQHASRNRPDPDAPFVPGDLPIVRPLTEPGNSGTTGDSSQEIPPFIDLTGASLRYGKCNYHNTNGEESSGTRQNHSFVSFRMCLGSAEQVTQDLSRSPFQCQADCQDYVTDMETYLAFASEHYKATQNGACNVCFAACGGTRDSATVSPPFVDQACDFCASGVEDEDDMHSYCWTRDSLGGWYSDDSGVDCSTCVDVCSRIENMNSNGYIDALQLTKCQMIFDYGDASLSALFAGPVCLGDRVAIGVFLDEDCLEYDPTKSAENYLRDGDGNPMKLSYAALKAVTNEAREKPLSCAVRAPLSITTSAPLEVSQACLDLQLESLHCHNGTFSEDVSMFPPLNPVLLKTFCPPENNEEDDASYPAESTPTEEDSTENLPSAEGPYFDLTGYSLSFDQCHGSNQQTAMEEASISLSAASAGRNGVKQVGSYVSFQMCLGGRSEHSTCQDEQDCQYYVVDIETYMELAHNHYLSAHHTACDVCTRQCGIDWMGIVRPGWGTTNTVDPPPFIGKVCDFCSAGGVEHDSRLSDATNHDSKCWAREQAGDWYALTSPLTSSSTANTVNCETCGMDCSMIEHMEENGYISAMAFMGCKKLYVEDGTKNLYAGLTCHDDGSNVQVGVFLDERCIDLDPSETVDDYLKNADGQRMQVSYDFTLHVTQHTARKPLSCAMDVLLSNEPARYDINDMCSTLKAESYACRDGSFGDQVPASARSGSPNAAVYESYCPATPYGTNSQEEPSYAPLREKDDEKITPTLVEEGGRLESSSATRTSLPWLSICSACAAVGSWLV